MKGKTFFLRLLFVFIVSGTFFITNEFTNAEGVISDIIINETAPSGDWVELLNTTDLEIDLAGWSLSQLANPNQDSWREPDAVALSGIVPANGLVVISLPDINNSGDVVSLYNPSIVIDPVRISFGTIHSEVAERYGSSTISAPASGKTISYISGSLVETDQTKGWFNDTSSVSAWSTVIAPFCAPLGPCPIGIVSNIATATNPSNISGLYFENSGFGKIEFTDSVNLTEQGAISTLQSISTSLDLGQGLIKFNPSTTSSLKNLGATLTMSGLPIGRLYLLSDIVVKNELSEILTLSDENYPNLSAFSADSEGGTLTFTTDHFTSFEVSTTSLDTVVPLVEISTPVSGSTLSGTASITASSTDDNSGISRVIFYYSTSSQISLIGQQTDISEPNTYTQNWDTTVVINGAYDLLVVAYDNQNNIATSTFSTVNVDNISLDSTPPTGSISTPLPEALATTTTIFQATALDTETGVKRVEFYIDGAVLLGSTETSEEENIYSISWTPVDKGLATGEHYVYAKFYNNDNYSTTTVSQLLNIDVTPPESISLSYDPSGRTRDNVTATLVTNRLVRLDGVGESTTTFAHIFTENGTHTFNYIDEVGHVGSSLATVVNIDRTAPIISGVLPISGSMVGGGTVLRFADSEFTDPQCQVDGLNWGSPCNNRTFGVIPGWGNILQGPFTLTIKDTDSAGNVGTIDTTYVKDTIAPDFVSAAIITSTTIRVRFSEDLETDSTKSHYISTDDFEVSVNGVINPITNLTENDGSVTLTVANPFAGTDPSVQLVINPVQPESVADLAGNVYTNKNIVTPNDEIDPLITAAGTNGTRSFVLTFSENLKNSILAGNFNAYAIRNGSTVSLPVSSISYSNKQISVNVGVDMAYGDIIHYGIEAESSISDLSDNLFNNGSAYSGIVTNNFSAPSGGSRGGGGGSGYVVPVTVVTSPIAGGTVLGTSTFRFMKNLSWCMENNDVRELQLRLTREGYLKVPATGYFGLKTLAAVKAYQTAHKLPSTGYFGPMTRAVMNGGINNGLTTVQVNSLLEQIKYIQTLLASLNKK